MERTVAWDSYFYPETINEAGYGTLKNKLGERDPLALRSIEYGYTAVRARELLSGSVRVDHTYGADHLRAIHHHLFQDIYDWAGEFRTINMGKNAAGFANIENGDLDQMLKEVQRAVGQVQWAGLNADQFAMSSAALFSFVNHAHPFREGNGRTSKIFMEHVAEQSKFTLDFSQVSRDLWNATSEASRPKPERPYLDPLPLVNVFALATKERGNEQTKETSTVHLDLSKASYPAPATKSLTKAPQGQDIKARRGTPYLPGQNLGAHER